MATPLRTLVELVSAASAAIEQWPEPENGQVRAVPDERTLRWYTTIGLLDRPLSWRGRTALYGERHLLQVLAIKRLQLSGHPVATIQELLLGAEDATLEAWSRGEKPGPVMPAEATPATAPAPSRRTSSFWAQSPTPTIPTISHLHLDVGHGATLVLPATRSPDAALDAALAPLRAWLARSQR